MRQLIVGLVTLFHPKNYTEKAGLLQPQSLPHIIRYRADMNRRQDELKKEGKVKFRYRYKGRHVYTDTGEEARRFGGKWILGETLAPFLAEPRIIFTPDRPDPEAKWKLEFRKNWPDALGALRDDYRTRLLGVIADSKLIINGLWINPTVDDNLPNPEWVNLVLGPYEGFSPAPKAPLRFFRAEGHLWVEWQ
jgi:hypothetical protein